MAAQTQEFAAQTQMLDEPGFGDNGGQNTKRRRVLGKQRPCGCSTASMGTTSGPTSSQESCSKLAGKSGPAIPEDGPVEPNVDHDSVEYADYADEHIRLECPPECPLLNSALDREGFGDIAGAMAALKRHRSKKCRWRIR